MSGAQTHSPTVREIGRSGGRVLGVCEYGDPEGSPVLAFHGIPGTRLMFRPTDEIARRLGLRIIAPDRPGFGCSTPQQGRTLQDWPADVEAVLNAYDIDRFSLIGVSGGSPFATATAAHYGDRVQAMILIGPMGPIADVKGKVETSRLARAFFLGVPMVPGLLHGTLMPANALFRVSPSLQYEIFLQALPAVDKTILRRPGRKAQVIEDVRESLKQGGEGMRADLRIFARPWNVDYAAIRARTVLWQGLADTIVPVEVALGLGALIPGCRVERIANAGHFWVYDNIELVLSELRKLSS